VSSTASTASCSRWRHLLDGHEDAALAAELRDLDAVGGQHLQVLARLVVGDLVQRRQVAASTTAGRASSSAPSSSTPASTSASSVNRKAALRRRAPAGRSRLRSRNSAEPSPLSLTSRICG
jgi:hypothetical protein